MRLSRYTVEQLGASKPVSHMAQEHNPQRIFRVFELLVQRLVVHLQRHPARLVLALDAFPLEEPFPIRRERTDTTVRAVRGDEQRVEPEQRRDLLLVVRQVLAKRSSN